MTLRGIARQSLVRSAYLAVLGDLLGSLGVIAAAMILLATGWKLADPIIGIVFGFFILPRAYDMLVGATLRGLNLAGLCRALEGMPGVRQVHDLHAWSITRGLDAMRGHFVADDLADPDAIVGNAQQILRGKFGIEH